MRGSLLAISKSLVALACSLSLLCAQQREVEQPDYPIPYKDVVPTCFMRQIHWTDVEGEPSWWRKPVQKAGSFSFRTKGVFGNARSARRTSFRNAKDTVRDLLFDHLQPVLGNAGTLPVLEEMLRQGLLVDAVLGQVVEGQGEGARDKHAACMCWRVPIRSVVGKFDPTLQGRIEWVLLRRVVHWRESAEVPKWVTTLPQRDGYLRCAFAARGNTPEVAQLGAVTGARVNMQEYLVSQLAAIVGKPTAVRAARAAVDRLGPVEKDFVDGRASRYKNGEKPKRGPQCTAYCLWEVPLGPLLRELPKEQREVARAVLLSK